MLECIITYEPGRHDACDVMHSSCIHLHYRLNRKVFVYKLAAAGLISQTTHRDELGATLPLVTAVVHRLYTLCI